MNNTPLRIIAAVLVVSFMFQDLASARGSLSSGSASMGELRLPYNMAITKPQGPVSSKERIIHIQDAHDSLDAQKKITELLNVDRKSTRLNSSH